MKITYDKLIEVGALLVSEDGENPEYDRAITEFIVDLVGFDGGMDVGRPIVTADLAAWKEADRLVMP